MENLSYAMVESQHPLLDQLLGRSGTLDVDHRVQLLAAVVLNRIIQYPMDRSTILDQRGSVCLVHFVPYEPGMDRQIDNRELDPVVPVILGDLGEKFESLMADYYDALMRWSPNFDINQNKSWGRSTRETVELILRVADIFRARGKGGLSDEEWDYFKLAVEACVCYPGTGIKLLQKGW